MTEPNGSDHSHAHLRVEIRPAFVLAGFHPSSLVPFDLVREVGEQLLSLQAQHRSRDIVLHFTGVVGLSSAMIGKLITLNRHCLADSRRLCLCEMEPDVARMFIEARLHDYFCCLKDVAEAESYLTGRSEEG